MQTVYERGFGMHPPYQILVDAEMCREALRNKVNMKEVLPVVLGRPAKLLSTLCVLSELKKGQYDADACVSGAYFVAKRFDVQKCPHAKTMQSGAACIVALVGEANKLHYGVAAQDTRLRGDVRRVPGVPLLHLHRGTLLLEDPTRTTLVAARKHEVDKCKPGAFEIKLLEKMVPVAAPSLPAVHKRKRAFRPNPLSCKPKTRSDGTEVPRPHKRRKRAGKGKKQE